MARRVTWTNNSTGYDGTNVYRDTTIDPQNLPEPIATVNPVAQGATVEYIDLTGSGDQCYAVQDFDSLGDGALSEAYCFDEDLFSGAQIGDEIQGGIYAGTIAYGDGREFHIVAAKAEGEAAGLEWGYYGTVTNASDDDDGFANQQVIIGLGGSEAVNHCEAYTSGGFGDWYLPARNELGLVYSSLSGHAEFSDNVTSSAWTWTSTEYGPEADDRAWHRRFTDNATGGLSKNYADNVRARPIRRVPV